MNPEFSKQRIDWGGKCSGITITYTKSRRCIYASGYYDIFVGIEGGEISLADFLMGLGITLSDCKKALGE